MQKNQIDNKYLWICVGVALAARVAYLWKPAFEIDTIQYNITWCRESFGFLFFNLLLNDVHPPLNFMVCWFARRLFGEGEFGMAIPSVLFGVATLVMVWFWTRQTGRPKAGIATLCLMSLCLYHVYWSQHPRMYAMQIFFCAGLFWVGDTLTVRSDKGLFVVLGICLGGAVGTQLFGVFPAVVAGAISVWVAARAYRERELDELRVFSVRLFYALAIPAILLWPWFGNMLVHSEMIGTGSLSEGAAHKSVMIADWNLLRTMAGAYGFGTGWGLPLFAGLVALGIVSEIRQRRWRTLFMLGASAALPFCVMAVVPFSHSFDVSYTSYIALMLWFWAGTGIAWAADLAGRRRAWVGAPAGVMSLAFAVALAAYAVPLSLYYRMEGRPIAYKRIVAELDRLTPENQQIVLENSYDIRITPEFYNTKKHVYFVFLDTRPFKTRREAVLNYLRENPQAWMLRGTTLSEPGEWADEAFERKIVFDNPAYDELMARGIFPRPGAPADPWVLYQGFKARRAP